MEVFSALISFLFVIVFSVAFTRWMFRIDFIVDILGKTEKHLEDMKKQNRILIKQQDEIIGLLDIDNRANGE